MNYAGQLYFDPALPENRKYICKIVRDIVTRYDVTQKLRSAEKLTPQGRRAVLVLFSPLIMPTLTLNREATQALGNAVAQTVEPVYYHIQKGEVVVYQGERVTREKHL